MELYQKISYAQSLLNEAEEELRLARMRARALASAHYPQLKEADFTAFLKEPYVLVPKRGHEWYCVVPRFVDFSVGWLERATASYNLFLINRYTLWLGDVPEDLRAATGLEKPPGDLQVLDGKLLFNRQDKPVAEHYKSYLSGLRSDSGVITRGKEFQLLAQLIEDGYLPFVPRPVAEADKRSPEVKFNFEGKYEFQGDAYKEFMRLGAVGIFWMTSAGKSFLAMAALDSIKGRKLIVVPTRTLVDQWKGYLKEHAPRLFNELLYRVSSGDLEVVTYNAYEKVRKSEFQMVLFDECHRLPATTFSKLATLKTKYRMGLSASPYREDGRTNYIIALTGYPIGQDWKSLIAILGKDFHTVDVWIVSSLASKLIKIGDLYHPGRKTLIFADSIDFGTQIAKRFSLPHVHGGTSKRMDVARASKAFVASRVMDEGVSINDLEHIIEADFLFGSRRQELQRTGRLLHSDASTQHDIIMTREEFDQYGKRLHGLVEKGFKINVHQ
jgi:DNA excision repair protein ERCC-3